MKLSLRPIFLTIGVLVLVSMASGVDGASSSASGGGGSTGLPNLTPIGTKIKGGTVTWAEGPQESPNYIFPIANGQVFTVNNVSQFQALMYRPLYWFGNDDKASLDYDYSLAQAPVWSNNDRTVTIHLNNRYVWSDGEPLNSQDVTFFMNVLKANPANFGAYVPGLFPDNVTSYSTPDAHTVVFNLDKPYNPTWFLYNQLSQITPMPLAWDRTSMSAPAPTPQTSPAQRPDGSKDGASKVYAFLDGLAKDSSSWVGSPIWSVVDGPFKLSAFSNTGEADFVPNPTYGGPNKPQIAEFKELPYTSDTAELNVLKSGPSTLTIGNIPPVNATSAQDSAIAAEGYNVFNAYSFAYNYFPLNLNNPKLGPLFRQLYFRQAMQHLVDQPGWIHAFFNGHAIAINGPVPVTPANTFASPTDRKALYSFSIDAARHLLTSHGWTIAGGVATCTNPGVGSGHCGDGVSKGQVISFNLDYASGATALDQEMRDLQSNASQAGIKLQLTTHPFASVYSAAAACQPSQPSCSWAAEAWGGGWVYWPDTYPSGEELFQTGAVSNPENWSDKSADRLIAATTSPNPNPQAALAKYEDYIIHQAPVVFIPEAAEVTAVSRHLGGFSVNAYTYLTPETFYLTH
jgi:peptide/nickel transport system substrate-binding protein